MFSRIRHGALPTAYPPPREEVGVRVRLFVSAGLLSVTPGTGFIPPVLRGLHRGQSQPDR